MKQLFLCLALSCVLYAKGQNMRPLMIGDTLPQVLFGETLLDNAPAKTINDIKAKLIILDFWSTGCLGCIHGMPHLDSLQQAFNHNIQIVIVCNSNRKNVASLFKRIKKEYPRVPMMLNDTLLHTLFPHTTVPHHVWIDQQGVVQFITYDHNATWSNIERFLRGEQLQLATKKELVDFNDEVSLFSEGKGRWNKDIQFHTLYAKSLDGVENVMPVLYTDTVNNCSTIRAINVPIRTLFQYAYNESFGEGEFYLDNRLDVRTKNSAFFSYEEPTDSLINGWKQKARASYEAVLPGTDSKLLFMMMRRDLNMYSPFVGHVEKQKVKCLVLINSGIEPSKGKASDSTYESSLEQGLIVTNYTIQNSVLSYLQNCNPQIKTPIIDGTGYAKGIDMVLKQFPNHLDDPAKLASVRLELQQSGLDIKEAYREIDMLVIEDHK
ncbi:TlpA family protein disulfide reductase [Pinibacter aurantiacus]|uniref:TlpA family protein disulfide reductase n=1 Tax=Pinibacter aurantiacus TaxID=2851599 RepID=A0A9E2W8V5_9BACT|nr:TlpA disulfide reductase family protein [Pinibacter aurantiacus]MBV4359086.1 TlpA family protein disulfide reductase [Pinibacter aurantiacus]